MAGAQVEEEDKVVSMAMIASNESSISTSHGNAANQAGVACVSPSTLSDIPTS